MIGEPKTLTLGQRVRFAATLRRTAQNASREPGQWPYRRMKVWKRGDYRGEPNPGEGVVVGLRTLYDGFVDWVDEGGYEFSPTQAHRAVLIATDVRHRPVLAFREDVEPVERSDDAAELVEAVEAYLAAEDHLDATMDDRYEVSDTRAAAEAVIRRKDELRQALSRVRGGER